MRNIRGALAGFMIAAAILAIPACAPERKDDPNSRVGYDGMTPVHRAAIAGDTVELEQQLSVQRVNPDIRDIAGVAPIHYAARAGHLDAVKMVVSYGANPTLRTSTGWRAIDLALREGHVDIVNFLSQYGFDPDESLPGGERYFAYAVRVGKADLVDWLVKHQVGLSIDVGGGLSALETYFHARDRERVTLLLNYGARLTRRVSGKDSPLHVAIEWEDLILINRLLGIGADPWVTDAEGRTASQHAAEAGLPDMAEILRNAEAARAQ